MYPLPEHLERPSAHSGRRERHGAELAGGAPGRRAAAPAGLVGQFPQPPPTAAEESPRGVLRGGRPRGTADHAAQVARDPGLMTGAQERRPDEGGGGGGG